MIERFDTLFELFSEAERELYLVGGCVRDLLMGRAPKDFDFATSATPKETKAILRGGDLRVVTIGEDFGTIATSIEGEAIEITTYRVKESYTKGSRHPQVVFGTELSADLGRRDLTINAMAMGVGGALVDPYGGEADLKRGVLRVPEGGLEKTIEIFGDDPLRMLRVGRFMSRLGFDPDEATTAAAQQVAHTILSVSRERWKDELDKIFLCEQPSHGLGWLAQVRVLYFILPELLSLGEARMGAVLGLLEEALEAQPLMRWVGLLHALGVPAADRPGGDHGAPALSSELAEGIARRFRFSNDAREAVCYLIERHRIGAEEGGSWSRIQARKLALDAGELHEPLMTFAVAWGSRQGEDVALRVRDWLEAHRVHMSSLLAAGPLAPDLPKGLGTRLIREAGVERGRRVGLWMDWLKEQILEESLPNGADAAVYVDAVRRERAD